MTAKEKTIREQIQDIIAVNCYTEEDQTNNVIMYDSFEKLTEDLLKLIDSLKILQVEAVINAYKDGFDAATETLISANKMIQSRKLEI